MSRYSERQRFRQDWLWALLLVGSVPGSVLAVVAILVDDGTSNDLLWIAVVLFLVVGPLVLFHRATFRIVVDSDGLRLQLWPLHVRARTIPCSDIERVRRVDISPMADFGGVGIRLNPTVYRWGIRFDGPMGYIVSGTTGVRIERDGARDLVLTSTDPRALVEALERECGPRYRPQD